MAGYKGTIYNRETGRRTETRDADYVIRGDVEVRGDLTQNGEAVGGGTSLSKATGTEIVTGTDDAKYVTAKAIKDALIPSGIKRYVALLTQSGTDAPVATILENTLGRTVDWSYEGTGLYYGTPSTGSWDMAKTAILIGTRYITSGVARLVMVVNQGPVIEIDTGVTDFGGGAVVPADGLLGATTIEIRVYP